MQQNRPLKIQIFSANQKFLKHHHKNHIDVDAEIDFFVEAA
jgi:hypothetical protein